MTERTAFFFIAQGEHLTAQAILLAASLRYHNGAAPDLIAYVPETPDAAPLPGPARAAFEALGVAVRPLTVTPGHWKTSYPHGNKLFACAAPRDAVRHVFLDSDMVCTAPLPVEAVIAPGAVALAPEGTPTWGKTGDGWRRVYDHFGLSLPTDRVRLTRRRRIAFLPYFNAGMVAFHRDAGAGGRGFADLWCDTARRIDHEVTVGKKRPWLDQIALPVTLKRFGIPCTVLGDAWNFSISDRAFEADAAPKLIHYHSFRFGPVWPQFRTERARMQTTLGAALMQALTPLYGAHWYRQPEGAA